MRIIFVSEHEEADRAALSGIPFHMLTYLRLHTDVIAFVHAPIIDLHIALAQPDLGRQMWADRAAIVSAAVDLRACDLVVASGTSCVAASSLSVPLVVWHDSTWGTLLGAAPAELAASTPFLLEWDERVLQHADLIVYASDWIRTQTLQTHDVDARKLAVVPFGPSVAVPPREKVVNWIANRSSRTLQLTFLGVDWRRKGLREAYAVFCRLRAVGISATFNVIGPELALANTPEGTRTSWSSRTPFDEDELLALRLRADPGVHLHGRLDKSRESDRWRFEQLLAASHFLLHPAHAECTGIGVLEALAFGVPVVAVNRQGPKDALSHGMNGALLEGVDFVPAAERWIRESVGGGRSYQRLAENAYETAVQTHCWERSVPEFLHVIGRRLGIPQA